MKIWRNASQRKKLSFENVSGAPRAQEPRFQKIVHANRGLNIYRWGPPGAPGPAPRRILKNENNKAKANANASTNASANADAKLY